MKKRVKHWSLLNNNIHPWKVEKRLILFIILDALLSSMLQNLHLSNYKRDSYLRSCILPWNTEATLIFATLQPPNKECVTNERVKGTRRKRVQGKMPRFFCACCYTNCGKVQIFLAKYAQRYFYDKTHVFSDCSK